VIRDNSVEVVVPTVVPNGAFLASASRRSSRL